MTKIIDGKLIANKLKHDLKNEIIQLKQKYNKVPGLAVVQVGNVAASSVYVNAKTKSANEVGINVIDHHLDDNVTELSAGAYLIHQVNKNFSPHFERVI